MLVVIRPRTKCDCSLHSREFRARAQRQPLTQPLARHLIHLPFAPPPSSAAPYVHGEDLPISVSLFCLPTLQSAAMEEHEDAVGHPAETEPLLAAATSSPPDVTAPPKTAAELRREQSLQDFRKRLVEHREWDTKLKNLRMGIRDLEKTFDKTEDDMKALQSVGQIVGEVLKQLDEEKFIVKASSGPRYVVGCRNKVNKAKLKQGARVGISSRSTT